MPLLGDVRKWALQPSEVSATLCAPHGSPPGHDFEDDCVTHLRRPARPAARRAPPPAPRLGRPDAEPSSPATASRRSTSRRSSAARRSRPRDGQVARVAARRRRLVPRRTASPATSARGPRRSSRAPRRCSTSTATTTTRSTSTRGARRRRRHRRRRAAGPRADRRGHRRSPRPGDVRTGDRAARAGARARRGLRVLRSSTAPRCSSGSASAAICSRASRRRSRSSTRRSRSPSARRCRPTCFGSNDLHVALALLPPPARLRGRARRRRARARARRVRCRTRGRSAQAYFQASLIAERDGHWVLARTYAERAKAQYEELTDRANVGRLLNNLGGLEFLLGKPERGGRAPEAFVRRRARARPRRRRGEGGLLARAGPPAHRRRRAGRGAGPPRAADPRRRARTCSTRSATHSSCSAASLLDQGRLDEADTAFADAEDLLRSAFVRVPPGRGLDRPG